ncbi:MAG: class I tRNA ligase family protein [Minisyncoccia bacterium]
MEPRYDIKEVESKIYERWERSGYFNPDECVAKGVTKNDAEPFCVVLPPPNVTGTLHIGHAFEDTIQDIVIRYERMKGKRTLWIPGTDHAAIATQAKVEKEIYKKEKKTRHDLGREEFLKRVDAFAKASHDTIVRQVKRLGASLDWSREAYTLDEARNLAVRTAFKRLYDLGLVYRGGRIVNWDPELQTTVSDDEVEWVEKTEPFYYLKYGPFAIATARPETKFGDKYVVMHPDDKRYAKYRHGEKLELEWINGPVTATVVKDPSIDMAFGTGVMTITPWHDAVDFDIAERHGLDREQIIDLHGKLLPIAGEFAGMHIKKARPLIVEKLRQKGLLAKVDEHYVHRVATNSRGGGIIEPQILKQWFVAANKQFTIPHSELKGIKSCATTTLKEIMRHVVQSGEITILPERFEKIYFHWIDNLRDWCVSRQIWFGHRIPAWYCGSAARADQPKMGWHEEVVPQVFDGKTKTYRLKDYGFKAGDKVLFENSETKTLFGYGIITEVEKTTVEKIDYRDKTHYKTYESLEELIAAFKLRNPEKTVTSKSAAYLYAYEFHPFTKKDAAEGCGNISTGNEPPKKCPACGGVKLVQDEDTFDTWFSSAMWTFSTLGWPEETKDLKTYHPTSFMGPGYEILFLWVARMILMSGSLLGQIPFRTVYLHGIVRDEQRRKFSKSLGNGVDPLELADKYGADALRMALVAGAASGNDVTFDEQKVKGYRNFSTKIWNIARFINMNKPAEIGTASAAARADKSALAKRKEIKELAALKKEVTAHLEHFDFHLAAEKLYHYVWHTLADKIVEAEKDKLRDGSAEEKAASYALLEHLLLESLKILHPFMPFVTEEIYDIFCPGKMLMVTRW